MTEDSMPDDSFERLLREAARAYHTPDATPRQEMWQRLQAARAARRAPRQRRHPFYPLFWMAAIAAGAILGVGLGRMMRARVPAPAAPVALHDAHPVAEPGTGSDQRGAERANTDNGGRAVDPAPLDGSVGRPHKRRRPRRSAQPALATAPVPKMPPLAPVYRAALTEHLGQSEVFLTLFRVSVQRGTANPLASMTARYLLATNRLLLDSPAGTDAPTRALLEDLELVLARIAQTSPGSKSDDLKSITAGIERAGVLARVRNGVPAGSGPAPGPGAL